MGINVGDATLTFLGDTTQLDLAFDRVNADAKGKVRPAAAEVENLAQEWRFAGQTASTAAEKAVVAGQEMNAAGELGARGMHEARGEMALLGEETGVRIPRHLRSFVAELPGVGQALSAAFSATAVLFLVQILAEGAQKLSEWIADTYIFTEAMKEQYKAEVELNNKIAEHVKHIEELDKAYKKIGKEAFQQTQVDIDELTKSIAKHDQELRTAEDNIYSYRNGLGATKEMAEEAAHAIGLLTITLADENKELVNIQLKQQEEELASFAKTQEARLAKAKTVGQAMVEVQLQSALIANARLKVSYLADVQAKTEAEEAKYKEDRDYMAKKMALLSQDPEKNKDALIALNGEIEALDLQHHAKMLANYREFLDRMKALKNQQVQTLTSDVKGDLALLSDAVDKTFQDLYQAYDRLGIQGTERLKEQLDAAEAAYQKLRDTGMASSLDLLQADRAILMMKIAIKEATGEETEELVKQLEKVNAAIENLIGSSDRLWRKHTSLFELWQRSAPKAGKTWKDLSELGKTAMDSFAKATEAALASAILSEESFGNALRRGTAQVLAEIAARSLVYAIFYTAMGFAKLAEQDYAGAANAFTAAAIYGTVGAATAAAAYLINPKDKGSSGTSAADNSAAKTQLPAQQPVTASNVIRFASGGVVSGPTLAVVGDTKSGGSQREAAIPLDDPEAVSSIKEALGGGGGNTTIIVQGLISPDNLTKVMRKMNAQVNRGQARLTSTQTFRVLKKG